MSRPSSAAKETPAEPAGRKPHAENPKRQALGKGLESLLSRPMASRAVAAPEPRAAEAPAQPAPPPAASSPATPDGAAFEIAVELIEVNPYQTRKSLDPEKLTELARSIEATGVLQPVTVRRLPDGRYQLISGERRWRASQLSGKSHVPAVVREASDAQVLEMTIIENLQREDLNPMEQARAFERLSREFRMTQDDIAKRTGKDRASVANFLRLMRLPDPVQKQVEDGELSFGHGKALLALGDAAEMVAMAGVITAKALSVRQTEALVQARIHPEHKPNSEQNKKTVDPNVREAEMRLQRQLGLRVKIQDKNGRGKVIIEYSRLEDFDALMETLGAQ
jgi:ParB family chromosome partitioning protein